MRAPILPCIDIAAVGQQPSSHFRSPEDNLRLWQFLTVTWMAPLISIGRKRQLHEDDVWFLGFEFQHRRLHDKFRRLRGSAISRLLQANGIDIFTITVIAIVQMLCGKFYYAVCSNLMLIACRLFYASVVAAAVTSNERCQSLERRGFDVCLSVTFCSLYRCAVTGFASLVWSQVLREKQGRDDHDDLREGLVKEEHFWRTSRRKVRRFTKRDGRLG